MRLSGWRDRLEVTVWVDAASAAGLGFMSLLIVGGVLVLAAKLNFPSIGAAGDFLDAFTAIVVAGLTSIGIPMVLDGLSVAALPLGALALIGAGVMWGVRSSFPVPSSPGLWGAIERGARVGVPFGLLCWFFALVFRFRGEHPVNADAGVALVVGMFWGTVFGALGALRMVERLRTVVGRVSAGIKARDRSVFEGLWTGGVMLSAAALGGAVATFLWIIVALARGAPGGHFDAGDAFAYVVYLAAFFPNVVVMLLSMSLGAPLDVGAKVNLGGELVGPLREYSVAAWGRGEPPLLLWLLVLVPLLACVVGGFLATRRNSDNKLMLPILLIASTTFSVAITLVGAIGHVRMAGVVKGSGYGMVAPRVELVLLFAFLFSGVAGFLGWSLGERTHLLDDRFPERE